MDNNIYKRFAAVFLALAPDFHMSAAEIVTHIKTKGFDSFAMIADGYDAGITEIAALLKSCGKGGVPNG